MSNLLTMEEHFAKAIDANPHDLETRQAHVDWLEEQGRVDEAKVWWSVRDRVPVNNPELPEGWFPAKCGWGQKYPLAMIPREIFYSMSHLEKNKYLPFLNLSALVREMLKQQAKEVPV